MNNPELQVWHKAFPFMVYFCYLIKCGNKWIISILPQSQITWQLFSLYPYFWVFCSVFIAKLYRIIKLAYKLLFQRVRWWQLCTNKKVTRPLIQIKVLSASSYIKIMLFGFWKVHNYIAITQMMKGIILASS